MTKTIILNDSFVSTRFEHDCKRCAFLGQYEEYDLYFCPQNGIPTVIARYGDEGSEYTSGLNSSTIALVEAQVRAEMAGML